jgi:hypothetical protein
MIKLRVKGDADRDALLGPDEYKKHVGA